MTIFVPIMMFGWLPFTMVLFMLLSPRKAAVVSLILGYLFLPGAQYDFPALPAYTKTTATYVPILFSTLLFDAQRLREIRFCKLDTPFLVWCCCPFASSLANGLGVYDGLSGVLGHVLEWGFPYVIGKMYFSDKRGLFDLAMWVVIGALIYIPFCVWEIRMGSTLHYYFYGFRTDRYATTLRLGGHRPVVFLKHGVALGIWMMSALMMGIWLWRTKAVRYVLSVPMGVIVGLLGIMFLFCRSLNAIILFAVGLFSYYAIRSWAWRSFALFLALSPAFYIVSRNVGIIASKNLVEIVRQHVDPDRATSLYIRLYHEERLVEKALHRPFFGWGGYDRNRLYDDDGNDVSITDGFWVGTIGVYGLVGLISVELVWLLPTIVFWRRYRFVDWGQPDLAPMVGFVCITPLYVLDCLMNAMLNPIFMVAAGGILAWLVNEDNKTCGTDVANESGSKEQKRAISS